MKLTNYIRDAYINSVMNDVPEVDYTDKIIKHVLASIGGDLPTQVAKIWKDPKTCGFIKKAGFMFNGVYVVVPTGDPYKAPKLNENDQLQLVELSKLHADQKTLRNTLRQKVKQTAYGCTTSKALIDLLPEFEKYLPAESGSTCRNLPVIANLMVDLVKAGWPKDGRKKPSIKPVAVAA